MFTKKLNIRTPVPILHRRKATVYSNYVHLSTDLYRPKNMKPASGWSVAGQAYTSFIDLRLGEGVNQSEHLFGEAQRSPFYQCMNREIPLVDKYKCWDSIKFILHADPT